MSKSFNDIFAETASIPIIPEWTNEERKRHAAEWTRQYDKGVEDERRRILNYLESRVSGHWGCRGSRFCPECIQWRQAITFVSEDTTHD